MDFHEHPQIQQPNVIAAFQGWNDAGQSATTAVRYLIESWGAKHFATIDPEEYFSFTDTRPMIRIVDGAQRELVWPKNEFYAFAGNDTSPAAVLMVGMEPNLKWRTFCSEIIDLAKTFDARRVLTMGSLVTDAVHTRPVPLTGFATDISVQAKFAARNVSRSYYEGPTGIVGTLHNLCVTAGLSSASIWAATPYYLGSTPNPKTAVSLLEAIDDALDLHLNLNEMRTVAKEFEQQVTMAVKDNTEVQEQIRALEERYDERGASAIPSSEELPSSRAIIADLEDFLRQNQRGSE